MREIKRRRSAGNEGEIDLTPMLDVVFIMLIFFIVTASFIKEPGIEVHRPAATTWADVQNQSILIAINAQDEIWIDKQQVDPRDLKTVISRMHVDNPKGAVVIQADENSTAEMYAKVWDAAKAVNIEDIHLATSKN